MEKVIAVGMDDLNSCPIDTTMVGWLDRVKLGEVEGSEFLRAKLVPTRQGDFTFFTERGDFTYGLDYDRVHGPTEE